MSLAALVLVGVSWARADTVKFTSFAYGNAHGGGAFTFQVQTPKGDLDRLIVDPVTNKWNTFCIEYGERINSPVSTYNATINGNASGSWAISGGNYAGEGALSGYGTSEPSQDLTGAWGDPISPETAVLFHQFCIDPAGIKKPDNTPIWDGSTSSKRNASADALQMAFWYLEHELKNDLARGKQNAAPNAHNVFRLGDLSQLAQDMIAWAQANDNGTILDVRVLNLFTLDGKRAQDQLVRVTHDAPVPLPSAAWLGLSLLCGLGAVRIARQRKAA